MTLAVAPKKIIIVAGPNGAGKTTFARSFLPIEPVLPRFINADAIAAGLAAFAPETAAIRAPLVSRTSGSTTRMPWTIGCSMITPSPSR